MPKRKHKKYKRPKNPFSSARIKEEGALIKRYGLKNKREIWKADSAIEKIRKQAKLFLTKTAQEQEKFIWKLKKQGFSVGSVADVLALNKEDYLKRRLQSVITNKKIASTPKQARQFIVHKHIKIDGKKVNIPSYIVKTEEEDKIELVAVKKEKPKTKNAIENVIEETKSEKIQEGN